MTIDLPSTQVEQGSDPNAQSAPDPLRMLIPGFLQPSGPGGVGGRDRGVLGTVGSVFDSLIEYTPIGDLRDAYEISTLVGTPRSALPNGMVAGTLGMLGAFVGGGKIAAPINARMAADLHADPSIPTSYRRAKTMTSRAVPALSWDQQQMRLTPQGHRARLISGSPILPHRALSVMAKTSDADIATMILEYGSPMVDTEMAIYDQWLTSKLGGRSIFDAPTPQKGAGSRSAPGDFAPTAPDEVFFGSERIAAQSLQSRLLQQMHPSALYANNVEELADWLSATDYQRVRGRTVPSLDENQTSERAAILAAWMSDDPTGADDFMIEQAREKATAANETQIHNAAKWATQKVRLAKMASAWNAQMVYGDFGPAFSHLWGRWANGEMRMGTAESDAFLATLTEFGNLVDYFPTADPSMGWTPNGRILGFEVNTTESSAVVFGEYGEPEFQQGGGQITAGTEALPSRPQPPGTVIGSARRIEQVGESNVPTVLGSKLIPKVSYQLRNTELIDPARPELGARWKLGNEHLTPSQLTMSGYKAEAMQAEMFGNVNNMFNEAANQTGDFTSFHRPYEEVQAAAELDSSQVDSVIPSRIVDYEIPKIVPHLQPHPAAPPMDIDAAIDTTANRFNTDKIQTVTVTIGNAGEMVLAPEDVSFVQALRDTEALERHGMRPPRVIQVKYANLDHANFPLVADVVKGGQVHEIQGYPGRDLVSKESYRAVYPTLITWVAHHTDYSYLQLAQVFGMYGMQTDLNATNIPALILDALGWTSRKTTVTEDGSSQVTLMRPKAAEEITQIVESLEGQEFTENTDATRFLMTQMEDWWHRWHDAGSRFARNNQEDTEEWKEWYGETPKMFAGMNATILDPGKAIFGMDANRLNQAADINGQFLSTLDMASDLAALQSLAEGTGKRKTKRWGAAVETPKGQPEGTGTVADILGPVVPKGKRETKKALEVALADPEFWFQRKYLGHTISYDPRSQRWEMQVKLEKAKLTGYFMSVSPARIDEVAKAPDIVSIPIDPAQIITDVSRYDNADVTLQDMIDVALALQSEQGVNLYRAIVADVHMAMVALGFSPGQLPDIKQEKSKYLGGGKVKSPAPAHQAQFGSTAAYRALGMGLLNLRMTKQGFEDAASLQSFLWYPWRILGGSSGSGYVINPRVLHALRGQISNPQNVEALRRVTPSTAQVRDFELNANQMNGLSAVVRMTADGQTGTRYVPRELADKNDAWWVIQDAEARVRVRNPTDKEPQRSTTQIFHPAIPRTGLMVTDAKAHVTRTVNTTVTRSTYEKVREQSRRRTRTERRALVEDSYALYKRIRQGAWHDQGAITDIDSFYGGTHGAWLRDWANGLGGVGYGTYNENALRALFMDPDAPPAVRRQLREHFLPGHTDEPNPLRNARGGAVARARRVAYDLTQRQLVAMGVPDEVIVWRQVLDPNDFSNGGEREETPEKRFEADAYKYAPVSFSLVPPVTGYFTRAIPFKVKRADIHMSTMAVAQGLQINDWQPYWQSENEVMIDWASVTELDPTEVLTSQAGASSFGVTYDSTYHTDSHAQPGEGVRRIQLLVPRATNKRSDVRMRAIADRIGQIVSGGRITPHFENAEVERPQWLLPVGDPNAMWGTQAEVLAELGDDPHVLQATRLILQAAGAARAGDADRFHNHLAAVRKHFVDTGKLSVLTADDVKDLQSRSAEAGITLSDRDVAAAVEIDRDRNTFSAVGDMLGQLEQRGLADWSTSPLAAELSAFLGEIGVIPTHASTVPMTAINFPINSSVDTENLLKLLYQPLAEVFPEYGDLSVTDAKREVKKLQDRGVTGKELAKAKARLTEARSASHLVKDLPPATGWLPKKEDDGVHEKGYRLMDVFGEVDPHWQVYSADPNDKVSYLTTALLGSGVHPDYQPEVAVEALSNDGMRAGAVFMELADTNHPHVRKVVMSRSKHKLLAGSANLHIDGDLRVQSEGDTHIWGEGAATVEADVGQFAIETSEDKVPEGYELGKATTKIDGVDRSLFGVRTYRLDNNGENPLLHRPSTMAVAIPDPLRGIKSVKQDRLQGDPAMEEPLVVPRPLVVFDEKRYLEYMAERGVTDTSRVVEVNLEWDDGEIREATIFVNDPVTAAMTKQLLMDTGVEGSNIDWLMLDVDQAAPQEVAAVA